MDIKTPTIGKETFVELNKKLAHLSKRVNLLQRHYDDMIVRAAQLETLAEAVQKNADKEKEMYSVLELMLGHGETSLSIVKYVFQFLYVLRQKCQVGFPVELKTVKDMHAASKLLPFKEHVLKIFPEFGLALSDLVALLTMLDFFTQDRILASELGVYIKKQADRAGSPPLPPLKSESETRQSGEEVKKLLKFITSKKLDKKTRSSLRRFIAVGQCTRTNRPIKNFPDLFLVKEILGLK